MKKRKNRRKQERRSYSERYDGFGGIKGANGWPHFQNRNTQNRNDRRKR